MHCLRIRYVERFRKCARYGVRRLFDETVVLCCQFELRVPLQEPASPTSLRSTRRSCESRGEKMCLASPEIVAAYNSWRWLMMLSDVKMHNLMDEINTVNMCHAFNPNSRNINRRIPKRTFGRDVCSPGGRIRRRHDQCPGRHALHRH